MRHKKAGPAELAGEWHWLRKITGGLGPRDLKQRLISAPACGEVCCRSRAAHARRESSPQAHFRARGRAPKRSCRRARRSLPLSDGSRLCVASLLLASNFSSSWAYALPSTTVSMLDLIEGHRARIYCGTNRKIQ